MPKKWFKQTRWVSYFNMMHSICWIILPVTKADTMCWLIYYFNLWYFWSLESEWIRYTVLAVSLRTIHICCIIWPLRKLDTMCYLIYCINVEYFWPLTSGLSIHTVLDIPQRLIKFCCIISPVKKSKNYVLAHLLCSSWLLLPSEKWFKQTHCVSYSKNIDSFLLHSLPVKK